MLVWLTLPFYDFCGFRSVAVNSVYKLQFFLHLYILTTRCTTGWMNYANEPSQAAPAVA